MTVQNRPRPLGSWQQRIVANAVQFGVVAWTEVKPSGRAAQYGASYQRRFSALHGLEVMHRGHRYRLMAGGVGPHGGWGIQAVGLLA